MFWAYEIMYVSICVYIGRLFIIYVCCVLCACCMGVEYDCMWCIHFLCHMFCVWLYVLSVIVCVCFILDNVTARDDISENDLLKLYIKSLCCCYNKFI